MPNEACLMIGLNGRFVPVMVGRTYSRRRRVRDVRRDQECAERTISGC
jgi:hypothetical protein